jgi:hypothetical protein
MRFGEKRMSVYVGYSDEASVGDANGEFLVSGYVANETEWPWFAKAWQERVLDGPPKLPFFHMTEMRSRGWREDCRISRMQAEDRIDEAVSVIRATGSLYAIGSVILQADIKEVIHARFPNRKAVPPGLDEPDYFCHLAFFYMAINDVSKRYPDVEKINFFVAKKNKVITRNLEAFPEQVRSLLNAVPPHLSDLMGDILPADPDHFLPLQAADAISWHLQRYYGDKRAGREHDRTDEARMWRLLKEQDGQLNEWNREMLEELCSALDKLEP